MKIKNVACEGQYNEQSTRLKILLLLSKTIVLILCIRIEILLYYIIRLASNNVQHARAHYGGDVPAVTRCLKDTEVAVGKIGLEERFFFFFGSSNKLLYY